MKINGIVAVVVIFLSGILVGFVGGQVYLRWRVMDMQKKGPEVLHEFLVKRCTEKLDLTPEQIPVLNKAVQEGVADLDRYRHEHSQEIWLRVEQMLSEVRTTLSPEQQQLLDMIKVEDLLPGPHPPPAK